VPGRASEVSRAALVTVAEHVAEPAHDLAVRHFGAHRR